MQYIVGCGKARGIQIIGQSIRKLLMKTMRSTQHEQTIVRLYIGRFELEEDDEIAIFPICIVNTDGYF